MVATSSSLGTAAALATFARGGNAMDAAIAADAALGVVQPMRSSTGGDLFAVVEHDGAVHAYNGSGALPAAFVAPDGAMPASGGESVTVPGVVEAWGALHARFGRLDLGTCLEPAMRIAGDGFPLGAEEPSEWAANARGLGEGTSAFILPGGKPPTQGQTIVNVPQARVLDAIAARGDRAFYEGWIGEAIVRAAREHRSALSMDDLAAHRGEWVEPLAPVRYRNWEIVELPPNGQGAVAAGAIAILAAGDDGSTANDLFSAERVHRQAEATKAAFTEAATCIGDPRAGGSVGRLCDPTWATEVARTLDEPPRTPPPEALPAPGGTVYVAVCDATTTVSLIGSVYVFFGSGVVVEEGGFVLQNRGAGFRARTPPTHPDHPAPGRRPYHTIIPALVRRDGMDRWGALGVTGGQFQPQGHVQVLHHLACGLDVQAALDAPRWQWLGGTLLSLEPGLRDDADGLTRRGHSLIDPGTLPFGAGQMVLPVDGYFHGGCDGRQDSLAAGM
jgi:gamma-glutamyltranspeptidase/glutathione hydrolase